MLPTINRGDVDRLGDGQIDERGDVAELWRTVKFQHVRPPCQAGDIEDFSGLKFGGSVAP